jgi:DNA-binding transcriptional regulator YbjK
MTDERGPADDGPARRTTTARGHARRAALVAAAARLLREQGPAGVTARGVAAAAGVPLAGVTYYFDDVAEMVRAASSQLLHEHLVQARDQLSGIGPRSSAATVARRLVAIVLGPYASQGSAGLAALYARTLAAAADQAWAADMRRWDQGFPPLVAELLRAAGRDDGWARALLACADGLAVSAGLRGIDDPERSLVAELAAVLDVLAPRIR